MKERLKVLYENSVIDTNVYNGCLKLHEGLMNDNELTTTNAYTVAMMHLAMALQRIKQNNVVNGMDEIVLNEIKKDSLFKEVDQLTESVLATIHVEMPDTEVQYLWLHFMTVLKEKGGDI